MGKFIKLHIKLRHKLGLRKKLLYLLKQLSWGFFSRGVLIIGKWRNGQVWDKSPLPSLDIKLQVKHFWSCGQWWHVVWVVWLILAGGDHWWQLQFFCDLGGGKFCCWVQIPVHNLLWICRFIEYDPNTNSPCIFELICPLFHLQ